MDVHKGMPGQVQSFTTSGVDGFLVFWDVKKLASQHGFQV